MVSHLTALAIFLPALLVGAKATGRMPVGLVSVPRAAEQTTTTTTTTTTQAYRWPWLRPRPRPASPGSWGIPFPMPPILPPIPPEPPKPKHVPLKSISTKATVQAWAYDVTSTLNYINNSPDLIEAQFVFPVPDTAAVYKFEATIGNRKLKAEIKNRTEAEQIYRDRVDAGESAALLESQEGTPDIYRIMIGNLRPNEDAVVVIGYAMPIERDTETGQLSVNLPVVLNPRYVPRDTLESPGGLDNIFHATVPYVAVSELPYTFSFSAHIDLGEGGSNQIKDIRSGSASDILSVRAGTGNRTALVALVSIFNPDHDFRLLIDVTEELQTKLYAEPGRPSSDGSGVAAWLAYDIVAAWFEPLGSVASGESNDEYWLVIDQSGSMSGDKIKNAAKALTYFVKSLPISSMFNIVGFGSRFSSLFPNAVEYTDSNVDIATNHAAGLDADMGGTEVLRPLQHINRKSLSPGVSKRFIVLLTDGEVSNTNQVINEARRHRDTTSVYSVGIGQGASTALVNGVARVSNGVSEYVRDKNDRLQAKVVDIIKMTRMPSATNVSVDWPASNDYTVALTTPEEPRNVAFRGREVMQYAVLERDTSQLQSTVRGINSLSAQIGTQPLSFTVPFTLGPQTGNADDPQPLHRLAAKSEITGLVDEYHNRYSEDVKKQVIDISKATGVLSEFTSLVAVDETGSVATDASGKPVFVSIQRPTVYDMSGPVMFGPAMSGGYGGGGGGGLSFSMHGPPPMAPSNVYRGRRPSYGQMGPAADASQAGNLGAPTASPVDELVLLARSASGTWPLNQQFVNAVGARGVTSVFDLRTRAQTAIQAKAPNVSDDTLATLIALAVFRTRYSGVQSEWGQVAGKGLGYLSGPNSGINPNDIDDHINKIAQALL